MEKNVWMKVLNQRAVPESKNLASGGFDKIGGWKGISKLGLSNRHSRLLTFA